MKRASIGTFTHFMAAMAGIIAVMAGLYWTTSRREAPVFVPIPAKHRTAFALDISLPTLRGETLRLAELRGQVVLLNIWATWCYPCRAEMPAMAALYRRYSTHQPFTIVAVANDPQGREVVEPFVEAHKLPFPILLDPDNSLAMQLDLPGIPSSYLLDQQGRIVLREVGQRDWNHPDMHRLLDTLFAASQTP
jgi:peroxiredoxin